MYKFVCFTMSSKLLCSNNFTQNVKLMNHYSLKCYLFFLFFLKIQKLSFNIFFHPFPPLKRLLTYEFFHFLYYNIHLIIFYASQKLYGKSFLFQKYCFYYKNNNKQVSLRLDERILKFRNRYLLTFFSFLLQAKDVNI